MTQIVVPALYTLAGLCGFAGGYHLISGLCAQRDRTTLLFGLVCLLAVPLALCQIGVYQASSVQDYLSSLRYDLSVVALLNMIFLWFVTAYTGLGTRWLLWATTLWFSVLLVVNLQEPYTIQYGGDLTIEQVTLPWGEKITRGVGETGHWFPVGLGSLIAVYGLWISVLFLHYRSSHESSSLILVVVLMFQASTTIQGAMVRQGYVDFPSLGPVGFLLVVITISLILQYQGWQRLRSSENRFRQLVEQCPLGIQVCLPDGHVAVVNPGWSKLWGATKEPLAHYNILEDRRLLEKGAMPYIEKAFEGTAADIPPIRYDPTKNEAAAGPFGDRWICAHAYPVKDDKGRLAEVILIHEDVTERKRVEDAIRYIAAGVSSAQGTDFFRQMVKSLAELFGAESAYVGVLDKHDPGLVNALVAWKAGAFAMGWCYEVAGTPTESVLGSGTCVFPRNVLRTFPTDGLLAELNAVSYVGAPLKNAKGEVTGVMGVIDDKPIDDYRQAQEILEIFASRAGAELERLEAEARIRRLAYEDSLTGLGSRPQLNERLADSLVSARKSGKYGALLLMDLDHFRFVNEALTHDFGDEILRCVGQRVSEAAGDEAFVARFGGDEFVALLDTKTDEIGAAEGLARRLAARVAEKLATPFVIGERSLTVGASIGIVVFPAHEQTEVDILRHADMALNAAKRRGRGSAKFYAPELLTAAAERLDLHEGLRNAVAQGELALYFQPQVNAEGEIVGAEALLRWCHPELGEVSPATFIPVAEEAGIIHALGNWVLAQACCQIRTWQRNGVPFKGYLSVNVSAWQLLVPDFVCQLRELMGIYGVHSRQLMLELTETCVMYDLQDSISKLAELRGLGVGVSLDDFGTGFSSLSYLKELPLDQLKIDKSFIVALDAAEEAPLVRTIIAIGRQMKLEVVAEGVETQSQREILEEMGCDKYQGYLFSRPLTDKQFEKLLIEEVQRKGRPADEDPIP